MKTKIIKCCGTCKEWLTFSASDEYGKCCWVIPKHPSSTFITRHATANVEGVNCPCWKAKRVKKVINEIH